MSERGGEPDTVVERDHADFLIQDHVAQMGQGVIADRAAERLGKSDAAIVLLRRIWRRELRALAEGRPLKAWNHAPPLAATRGT